MRLSLGKIIPSAIPAVLLMLTVTAFASTSTSAPSSKHSTTHSTNTRVHRHHAGIRHVSEKIRRSLHLGGSRHTRGPAQMPTDRVIQIQTALIQHGYQSGEPTGRWDAQTAAAMQKLQADHGWQTRITPDSRALILLGLGPHDGEPTATPVAGQAAGETAGQMAGANRAAAGSAATDAGAGEHPVADAGSSGSEGSHQAQILAQTQQQ